MIMVGVKNQLKEIGFIKKVAKMRGWRTEEKDVFNFTIWQNETDYIERKEVPIPSGSSVKWTIYRIGLLKICGFDQVLAELEEILKC